MRRLIAVALFALACHKPAEQPAASTASPSSAPPPAASTAAPAPAHDAEDLLGIAQGAIVVRAPEALETGHIAMFMFDEDKGTRYTTPEGKAVNQATVVQLAERSAIEQLQFDTGTDLGLDTHAPKEIRVEMSDTSADDGFKQIADVTLAQMKDDQRFPADANVPGRFVRITIVGNYGAGLTEVPEVRAFGKKLTTTALANLTGSYKVDDRGAMNLKQDGAQVSGCLDWSSAKPVVGGIEGHVLRFTYETEVDKGPAIIAFSTDGKTFAGGYWKTNGVEEHPAMTPLTGTRVSDTAKCPTSPSEEMTAALEKDKRLRLYGINFDSDSDRLRDESKPTLDMVANILKQHAGWKLTIEGHTDSTSTPEHNHTLSESRANAVKTYLTGAGIDASRLTPKGLGATQPIASNDNALGRAANRRVELVRE
jgi:outer membrane protein OmpA-like peptidoglycan-associated protein